jgi:uncharacterized integral membrane protein
MYAITYALLLLWGIAFSERLYSMVTSERASSAWSLLFVGAMLCLHLALLYTESYNLVDI